MRSLKAILLGLIISLTSGSLFGQTDSTIYKSQIQFNLINGYSLSYLNFLSETSALRYKLDFNFSVTDKSGDVKNFHNGVENITDVNSQDSKNNAQMISFTSQFINSIVSNTDLKLYVGVGPYIEFNRSYQKRDDNHIYMDNSDDYSNCSEIINKSFSVGVKALIGIEYFITKQISLVGEYEFYGAHFWQKNENSYVFNNYYSDGSLSTSTTDGSSTNYDGWNAGVNGVRLGVGFRF